MVRGVPSTPSVWPPEPGKCFTVAMTESSVSSLTKQLDAATQQEPLRVRELAARLREQETLVAGVLAEGMQVAGQLLASERESFAALRDGSVARQTLLQARLAALQKQQGGETAHGAGSR